ncbi:MAG: helix-turn-helix domain-containing protein [Chloroflexota bacterium]
MLTPSIAVEDRQETCGDACMPGWIRMAGRSPRWGTVHDWQHHEAEGERRAYTAPRIQVSDDDPLAIAARTGSLDGERLTPTERRLLAALVERMGTVAPYSALMAAAFGVAPRTFLEFPDQHRLRIARSRLAAKLGVHRARLRTCTGDGLLLSHALEVTG